MLDDMLARANSACLRCRALIRAYVIRCLYGFTALCCAVLCCVVLCAACGMVIHLTVKKLHKKKQKKEREESEESKKLQEGSPTSNVLVCNYRLRRGERWKNMPRVSSEGGRYLQE